MKCKRALIVVDAFAMYVSSCLLCFVVVCCVLMPRLILAYLCHRYSSQCPCLSLPCPSHAGPRNTSPLLFTSLPSRCISLPCRGHSSRITTLPCRRRAVPCHAFALRCIAGANLNITMLNLRSAVHCLFSANLSYAFANLRFAEVLPRCSLPQLRTSMPSCHRASPRQCVSTHFRAKLSRRMSLQCLYSSVPCYAFAVLFYASAMPLSAEPLRCCSLPVQLFTGLCLRPALRRCS